jgi:hypothetical protein
MICFSISAPFPWGTRGRSGYCSQGERLHSGRDPKESEGGTGKAEDAKLPGAGIIPKPCPRKGAAEMEQASNHPVVVGIAERDYGRVSSATRKHQLPFPLRRHVTEEVAGGYVTSISLPAGEPPISVLRS